MSFSKQVLSYFDLSFQIFSLRILGILLAYLNIIILANKLSVSQFGIYASVLALASIIAVILGLGCPGLSMRNIPRLQSKGHKKFLIWHYTKIILISCIFMLALGLFLKLTNLLNYEIIFVMLISLLTSLLRFGETVLKSIEIQRWSIFVGGVLPHLSTIILYIIFPLNLNLVLILVTMSLILSSTLSFILIKLEFKGTSSKKFKFEDTEIKARDVISTHYDHLSYVILTLLVSLFQSGIIPFLRSLGELKEAAVLAISLKVIVPFQAARSAIIAQNTPIVLKLLANGDYFELQNRITEASKSLRVYGLGILFLTIIYAYITEFILPDSYSGLMLYMIIIAISQCASLFLGFYQALHTSFDLVLRLISMILIFVLLFILAVLMYLYGHNTLYIHLILSIALFIMFFIFYCIGRYGIKRSCIN